MTRAMNLRLPEAYVQRQCMKSGISISAIEPLPSGGTHLVCTTMEGAVAFRSKFAEYVIQGPVGRFRFYRRSGPGWGSVPPQAK